jgi:acylglycerol lipase
MAPALMNQLGDFVVGLASVLKKVLPENMRLTKPIYGMASKNPRITEDVKHDPCAFKERTHLSTAHMIVDTMDKSPDTFKYYKSPFLVIQGGLDKLVNPSVAFELFARSSTPVEDKDILFYENMWHDIWHEDEIGEIIEKIGEWLEHRLAVRAQRLNQ